MSRAHINGEGKIDIYESYWDTSVILPKLAWFQGWTILKAILIIEKYIYEQIRKLNHSMNEKLN
jgi:hypothetical protein